MRAYPFDRLPRLARGDAAIETAVARWLAIRPRSGELAKLAGGPVHAMIVRAGRPADLDPHAASCEARVGGASFGVRGGSAAVRHLAQRLLGGPDELAAPRPLGAVEHAIWALAVAAALDDLGIAGEVWPCDEPAIAGYAIELAIDLAGTALTAVVTAPSLVELRAPPPRAPPAWTESALLDVPVVVGRCALATNALATLAIRDVITLDRAFELEIFGGVVGWRAAPGAVVAEVTTGYVRRDMSLPDDACVELTVALGTTQLSLRQVFELAVGQIVPLGRPLAGPFELRAAGRRVGHGELVDVDGELGVRIVSLEA